MFFFDVDHEFTAGNITRSTQARGNIFVTIVMRNPVISSQIRSADHVKAQLQLTEIDDLVPLRG